MEFDIGYNPAVLAATAIGEGSFLSGAGSTFFLAGTIDNAAGSLTATADSLFSATAGATGSGALAVVSFLVIGPGTSPVSLLNAQLLDSTLSSIPVTSTNGSVTAAGLATPEPGSLSTLSALAVPLLALCLRQKRAALFGAVVVIFALGAAAPANAQISDTTPPVLQSLSFSATSLNATSGTATLTVTAHITDDLAGFQPIRVSYFQSSGQAVYVFFNLLSGNSLDGIWQATVTFSRFSASGTWQLTVNLTDLVGNFRGMTPANLAAAGFPNSISLTSTPDLQPPALSSLVFSPTTVNVSTGPQVVTVKMGVTDDLSGANFSTNYIPCGDFVVVSPSGKQIRAIGDLGFTLVSGTALNGVWQGSFVMPQYSEAGEWKVKSIRIYDVATNTVTLSGSSLASALSNAGSTGTFTVVSVNPDLTPPTLLGFNFTPSFVNATTQSAQSISFNIQASDNLSGGSFLYEQFPSYSCTASSVNPGVTVRSPSGAQSGVSIAFSGQDAVGATIASGTPLNGIWQAVVPFRQFSEAGTWNVSLLQFSDVAGDVSTFNTSQLAALGFPTTFQVTLPSGAADGSIGSGGGTVADQVFGSRAELAVPAGLFSGNTSVSIDVLQSAVNAPTPQGFSGPGTYFVDIELTPHPSGLLPPPGATLTIPLSTARTAGSTLTLYKVNGATNPPTLTPEPAVGGGFVVGHVNADGLSATFTGVASFSTVVGLISNGQIPGDVNTDGSVDCTDVAIVKAAFGKRSGQTGYDTRADINRDGVVDVNDLAFILKQLPTGSVCH